MKKQTPKKKQPKGFDAGECLVGYQDDKGKVHWQKVDVEWREVKPAVRKSQRKAG
jgi:hypothetical protein